MSRYLEIDSSFRDRNLWPLPGQFEIPISQTGRKSRYDALDPVCLSVPITQWTSNNLDTSSSPSQSISCVIDGSKPISYTSEGGNFIIRTSGTFQQLDDYYVGLTVRNTTNSSERRIVAYKYLYNSSGNDYAEISVFPPFSDSTFSIGDSITINDPTDLTDTSNPLIFVPDGELQQNGYVNCILYNETRKQYRNIIDYSEITHILKIDTIGGPVTGWTITDNFCIRKEAPLLQTTVGGAVTITANLLTPPTDLTVGIVGGIYTVTSSTHLWLCTSATPPTYKWVDLGALSTSTPTTNQLIIVGGISENDVYKNQHLRILPSPTTTYNYPLASPINEISRIISYDGTTKIATVYPPFSSAPSTGQDIEILAFSYDNLNPFVYTGSLISQQEMVCYEIELLNIILPNETLHVGKGGRIAFYPYIYVEISNVSASGAGLKNIIYSNNPNAVKMTFRVPISDMSNPTISPFTKNDASGMIQTIKFKPNDNLFFSVKLPNGEIFDTVLDETYSPYPVNYHSQISAAFRLNRI